MTMVKSIAGSAIKQIPVEELSKHKVADIMGFVKAGNLSMVFGLIDNNGLGMNALSLSGLKEEFTIAKSPPPS